MNKGLARKSPAENINHFIGDAGMVVRHGNLIAGKPHGFAQFLFFQRDLIAAVEFAEKSRQYGTRKRPRLAFVKPQVFNPKAGFFKHFAMNRIFQAFAGFGVAGNQRIVAVVAVPGGVVGEQQAVAVCYGHDDAGCRGEPVVCRSGRKNGWNHTKATAGSRLYPQNPESAVRESGKFPWCASPSLLRREKHRARAVRLPKDKRPFHRWQKDSADVRRLGKDAVPPDKPRAVPGEKRRSDGKAKPDRLHAGRGEDRRCDKDAGQYPES